jgi:hypothetical protein
MQQPQILQTIVKVRIAPRKTANRDLVLKNVVAEGVAEIRTTTSRTLVTWGGAIDTQTLSVMRAAKATSRFLAADHLVCRHAKHCIRPMRCVRL